MALQITLHVVRGDAGARSIDLTLPAVIGRGEDVALRLRHKMTSRRHCELTEQDGQIVATDLGSLNGSFLSKQRITAPTVVPPQSLLTIGAVTFRVDYVPASPPADIAPVPPATIPVAAIAAVPIAAHAVVEESLASAETPAALPTGSDVPADGDVLETLDVLDSDELAIADAPLLAAESALDLEDLVEAEEFPADDLADFLKSFDPTR